MRKATKSDAELAENFLRLTIAKLNRIISGICADRKIDYSSAFTLIASNFEQRKIAQNVVENAFNKGVTPYSYMKLPTLVAYNQYLGMIANNLQLNKSFNQSIAIAKNNLSPFQYLTYNHSQTTNREMSIKKMDNAIMYIENNFGNLGKFYKFDQVYNARQKVEEERKNSVVVKFANSETAENVKNNNFNTVEDTNKDPTILFDKNGIPVMYNSSTHQYCYETGKVCKGVVFDNSGTETYNPADDAERN